jgi:hypothetical protein
MAAGDLTTLANLEAWLDVASGNPDEALLSRLISVASARINGYLQRNIGTLSTSYTETRNGSGTGLMLAKVWPVTSFTSVTINGATVPKGASGSSGWYAPVWDGVSFPIPEPYVGLSAGWTAAFGAPGWGWGPGCWNGWFPVGIQNVVLVYTAGFAAVPTDIEQACIELASQAYQRRGTRLDLKSLTQAQQTTSYEMKMLPSVKEMLAPYRRVAPLVI